MTTVGDLRSSPLFVVGYMHSGTTFLKNILANAPDILASTGESKFFHCLPMIRSRFPDLAGDEALCGLIAFTADILLNGFTVEQGVVPPPIDALPIDGDYLLGLARVEPGYAEVFRIVFDELTLLCGKARWLEKTPTHVFHAQMIWRAIPNARFIEIVRDARAIVASKKMRRDVVWKTDCYDDETRAKKELEKAYDPVWDTLSWKSIIRAGRAAHQLRGDQVLTVRYEDLVTDPAPVVRRICDFAAVDYTPEMLKVSGRNSAEMSRAAHGMQGIASDGLRRWDGVLSAGETVLCQWLADPELTSLGYQPDRVSPVAFAELPVLVARSQVEFLLRLWRRFRLGGYGFLRNTVVNYLIRGAALVRRR